ncbi:hypothetical protein [Spiroplasma taiwanense]|uniref:Uncharacterized protein n=1 Tax=Spiroplasma taiwanense CT-1 TaxID=1276220 RepID=S5MH20_9MOLU|nr:hypothetical protein [Spiroplasma taiwanense]AGR41140.1 hypothetical protein STAIW_v1c05040 [Spiroplasma taiwanense CT-1]
MSYLNYKNLSTYFLKNLDLIHLEEGLINNIGLNILLNQWVDYGIFKSEIQLLTSPKELAKILLWFYKKYTSGISITFNPNFTNGFDLLNWDNWNWKRENIDDMFKKKIDLWNGNDQDIFELTNKNFIPDLNKKNRYGWN